MDFISRKRCRTTIPFSSLSCENWDSINYIERVKMENKKSKFGYTLNFKLNDLDDYIRNYICMTIPSVHRDIRVHLLDELYILTGNIYRATYTKGNIRIKALNECKVSMSLIDNLLNKLRKIKNIDNQKLNVCSSKLSDLKNIIYGWLYNEEKAK